MNKECVLDLHLLFSKEHHEQQLQQEIGSINPNYKTAQEFGLIEPNNTYFPLGIFVLHIVPLLGRPAIEVSYLPQGLDALNPRCLVGPFLVSHVEILEDVVESNLVIRPDHLLHL
jgi:hypothetical protein